MLPALAGEDVSPVRTALPLALTPVPPPRGSKLNWSSLLGWPRTSQALGEEEPSQLFWAERAQWVWTASILEQLIGQLLT